jgi:hypothetical protein
MCEGGIILYLCKVKTLKDMGACSSKKSTSNVVLPTPTNNKEGNPTAESCSKELLLPDSTVEPS